MSKFQCEICCKIFNKSSHLKAHKNKKVPCERLGHTLQDPPVITQNLLQDPPETLQDPPETLQDPPIPPTIDLEISFKKGREPPGPSRTLQGPSRKPPGPSRTLQVPPVEHQDDNKNKIFSCPSCGVVFKRKDNLKRHIDKRCLGKEKSNENSEQVKTHIAQTINTVQEMVGHVELDDKTKLILTVLMKQNDQLLKEIGILRTDNNTLKTEVSKLKQTTTINNTLNNQNNIILAHGKEEFNKIDLEQIMKCLSTIQFKDIIPNMTKHIYLNDEKPQNKNFCIVDISRNKCKYFNGEKWLSGKSSDKISKIFDNVHNVLTEPFEKDNINKTIEFIKANPKKFSKKFIDYAKTFLDNIYNDEEKESRENILNELKYIFYNNRDAILKINQEKQTTLL